MQEYFDPANSDDQIRAKHPSVMTASGRFNPAATRRTLLDRGVLRANIVRYAYRPFDVRWLYWEPETKLLDEKRAEYWPHVVPGNLFLSAGERNRKEIFYQPQIVRPIADHHLVESNVAMFPLVLNGGQQNLPSSLLEQVTASGLPPSTIFHHVAAILNAPAYFGENAGALRMDWPRVPLPGDAENLRASAALGTTLAILLDPETPAPGVSTGSLRPGLKGLALPAQRDGKSLGDDDLRVSARWGSMQTAGGSRIIMPGPGLIAARPPSVRLLPYRRVSVTILAIVSMSNRKPGVSSA